MVVCGTSTVVERVEQTSDEEEEPKLMHRSLSPPAPKRIRARSIQTDEGRAK